LYDYEVIKKNIHWLDARWSARILGERGVNKESGTGRPRGAETHSIGCVLQGYPMRETGGVTTYSPPRHPCTKVIYQDSRTRMIVYIVHVFTKIWTL